MGNLQPKPSKLERIAQTIKTEAKWYLVDTSISLLYANTVFGIGEYFIAGMEPDELLKIRVGMSLLGLGIYWPYGKFRKLWAGLCHADIQSSRIKKYLTDISGNVTFFTPVYFGITCLSGASLLEIGAALAAGTATAPATAVVYGWVLDKWRKAWGMEPTLYSSKSK